MINALHIDALSDTYRSMKTTVEIQDALLKEAQKLASRENTTVRALVEEGLRKIIVTRTRPEAFRLRKVTFKGNGLQPDVEGAPWPRVRDMAYEGRGG